MSSGKTNSNSAPPPQQHLRNGSTSSNRMSQEIPFRQMASGSVNIANGAPAAVSQNGSGNGQPHQQNMVPQMPGPPFAGARSPPNKQNTSHVPCKFFRQGACQAGKACPFSHDMNATMDNVCKYFAKGNCKFGPKCANIHVLPNGQRVNYKGGPMAMGGGHLNLGGRVNPDPYHGGSSALTNAMYRAAQMAPGYGGQYSPYQSQDEQFPSLDGRTGADKAGMPMIDTSYVSQTGSAYGSPRDDELQSRFSLGFSPGVAKGLSVLDAPLPASFDSNGISYIARHGPIAASVPKTFGLESPAASLGYAKDGRTSEALKNLHSSAFGDDTRDRFNGVPASPPTGLSDEYFGKRPMHSQRFSKPGMLSASVPKGRIDRDWEANFDFDNEEDYIPDNLKDLLTPQEKARRMSRTGDDDGRLAHSGTGTPDPSSKFGSPSNASPSRWGPLFQRQQEEEQRAASRASAFGHVGSPLRNSSMLGGSSPSSRVIGRPSPSTNELTSPWVSSPPRQSSMSIISQQLQRTRLSRAESSSNDPAPSLSNASLHPNSRPTSNPIGTARRTDMDRQVSSSSIATNRFTTPIDEEQGDFVFSMEEEEDREREKRNSGGWSYPTSGRSPHLKAQGGRNGSVVGSSGSSIGGLGEAR